MHECRRTTSTPRSVVSHELKLGLVQCHTATEAARGQLAVRRGELGGEDHIAVRVDGADLPQAAGLDGQAVGQLPAALIKGQKADAVSVRRADETPVGTETQLLYVASPDVRLLDVVGETQGAAGRDQRPGGRPLLKLVHTGPLLVVHVAGTADECGPAFRMELEGGDAVPSVPLSWDLRGQHFQTVSGREAFSVRVDFTGVISLTSSCRP